MESAPNPVLTGTYPDPSVCRVGGDVYLVTSTFEYLPGLPVFHSTDLVHWEQVGHVIDREGQLDLSSVPSSGGLFAPTIRWHDGTFFVVCTVVGGTGRQGHFLVMATDAAGPWSDPVWFDDAPGIDPSLFFDDDGRAWFHGTRLADPGDWPEQTEVWIRELDLGTLRLVGDEHVVWHGAVQGAVWAEGPHLYRRGDWYYLLASEGGTEFFHAVSVARSRSVTGPYAGYRGNPVLTHRDLGRGAAVANVGHPDLLEAADGSWTAFLLATRPDAAAGGGALLGRETYAVPVAWQDDWPVFAPGVGRVELGAQPSRAAGMPGRLEWTGVRSPRDVIGVDPATATVTLVARPDPLDAVGVPAFVGVRQAHRRARFGATLARSEAARAGIVARQSDDAWLALTVAGDRVVLERRSAGVAVTVAEATARAGDIRLEVEVRDGVYAFLVEGDELAAGDGRFLASEVAGGFVGVWLGLAAVGDGERVVFGEVSYAGE